MIRLLSSLMAAGLIALPAVASAEPQYVYVRYSNGLPYIYVTTVPRPIDSRGYVRADLVRFDSEVAAACGLGSTQINFGPSDTALDYTDRTQLTSLGFCLSRGPLAGTSIEVVAAYDGSEGSLQESYYRQRAVLDYLHSTGVAPWQLSLAREILPSWMSDQVRFRMKSPSPVIY